MVITGIYLYYPIYQAKKTGRKIVASTIPFEQHPALPNKYILVAGDSTAAGVGANNPQETIAGRLGKEFPNADITNLGVSGDKLSELLSILKSLEQRHFDLIVLQIGSNDITHFTSSEKIRNEIGQILAICDKLSYKTILLTSGNIGNAHVFHWPLTWLFTARTLQLRSIFMEESAKHPQVSYIDLYTDRENDPFEKDIKKYYAPDLFHLTGEGYGVWYEHIQKAIK